MIARGPTPTQGEMILERYGSPGDYFTSLPHLQSHLENENRHKKLNTQKDTDEID